MKEVEGKHKLLFNMNQIRKRIDERVMRVLKDAANRIGDQEKANKEDILGHLKKITKLMINLGMKPYLHNVLDAVIRRAITTSEMCISMNTFNSKLNCIWYAYEEDYGKA